MVNKENYMYYQEYIVYSTYQTVSTKAVVQAEFPAYALSEHKKKKTYKV